MESSDAHLYMYYHTAHCRMGAYQRGGTILIHFFKVFADTRNR